MPAVITQQELRSLLSSDAKVTLIEALGADFYDSGHLPGAINLPPGRADSIAHGALGPDPGIVVVYCSSGGTQCTQLAERLTSVGYRDVRVYAGGKEEWAEAGLPLEYGSSPDPTAS